MSDIQALDFMDMDLWKGQMRIKKKTADVVKNWTGQFSLSCQRGDELES